MKEHAFCFTFVVCPWHSEGYGSLWLKQALENINVGVVLNQQWCKGREAFVDSLQELCLTRVLLEHSSPQGFLHMHEIFPSDCSAPCSLSLSRINFARRSSSFGQNVNLRRRRRRRRRRGNASHFASLRPQDSARPRRNSLPSQPNWRRPAQNEADHLN